MPLHFALNYCCWLVLPDVEVFFEVKTHVLFSGKIKYYPVWFDASPKSCAKSAQLDVVRENYQFLILDQSGKILNELFSIGIMKKTEPPFYPLFIYFRIKRTFLCLLPFFLHSHFNPLCNKDTRRTRHIYCNLVKIQTPSIFGVNN